MSVEATQIFCRMAANNQWSNARLHKVIAALEPGEFAARRTGFFPSIAATLNHILEVDLYYIDTLCETGAGMAVFEDFTAYEDIQSLAAAQARSDQALTAFCEQLGENDLSRRVASDRGRQGVFQERIADLLNHLFLHQIHHRGQVHAMLSGTSLDPPQLDEFFLDFDEPFRRDEVAALWPGDEVR